MGEFFTAFGVAFGVVVLAEMGDKTQLLAMAFATKYKASKVMIGVFIATILNHAMAVAVGHFFTRFESIQLLIQGLAALAFIFFGLWTIKEDKLEGEENKKTKFGAIATVAIAFFLAEMGDKTQLATITLATRFPSSSVAILIGTTTGMLIADGFGIFVGHILKKKIPERKIKLIAAGIFIIFGLFSSFEVLSNELKLQIMYIIIIIIFLIIITGISCYFLIKNNNKKV